jgi:hypothetical protein
MADKKANIDETFAAEATAWRGWGAFMDSYLRHMECRLHDRHPHNGRAVEPAREGARAAMTSHAGLGCTSHIPSSLAGMSPAGWEARP